MANEQEPKTLQQAVIYFSDPQNCLDYMVPRIWPNGVVTCPTCGRNDPKFLANQWRWQCKSVHPKRQFSAKVGTIFEDSPIPLQKWLPAVWALVNCKNGISSWELHRMLGVTQKTAWFMLHRIRLGMRANHPDEMGKLGGSGFGPIEVDETFVGGQKKFMHAGKRLRYEQAGGKTAKTVVMGFLDRDLRRVRTKIVPNIKRETLQDALLSEVHYGAKVYTDQAVAYDRLHNVFVHETVNKLESYVKGQVHVNGLENFWSCLKRTLKGTYIAIEPFHLERYLDEQMFRFNNRATKDNPLNDSDRFALAISKIIGKRLTYSELTGKVGETPF